MSRERKHIDEVLKSKLEGLNFPVSDAEWEAYGQFRNRRKSEESGLLSLFQVLRGKLSALGSGIGESDWVLFNRAIAAVKAKRRRRFIWRLSALLLLLSLMGVITWQIGLSGSRNSHYADSTESGKETGNTPEESIKAKDPFGQTQDPSGIDEQENHTDQTGRTSSPDAETVKSQPGHNNTTDKGGDQWSPEMQTEAPPDFPPGLTQGFKPGVQGRPEVEGHGPGIPGSAVQHPEPWSIQSIPFSLTLGLNPVLPPARRLEAFNPEKKTPNYRGPSLALGYMVGFGNPALYTGGANPAEIHSQYTDVMKSSRGTAQVHRVYLRYEHRWKTPFDFGAGLEYSYNKTTRQFNYVRKTIPFYWTDKKTILAEIPIPEEDQVTSEFTSTQFTSSILVPLSLGYSKYLSKEWLVGARIRYALGYAWGADYLGLHQGELQERTISSNIKPFSMVYGAGLYGEYFYLTNYSVRASFDVSASSKQYQKNNSYNLTNRFYEFNLAMIWYLK